MFIPKWKWESLTMDFIVRLPKIKKGYDSIWLIVDCLTKVAHFLLVQTTYMAAQYARLFLDKIIPLLGVPTSIILDKGSQFTSYYDLRTNFPILCQRVYTHINVYYEEVNKLIDLNVE